MPTRTIDLLLNLEAEKAPSVDMLKKQLSDLEKKATEAKKVVRGLLLIDGEGAASVRKARQNLNAIEQEIRDIDAQARKMTLAKSLKQAEEQANKTREKMEKLAQVGSRLAVTGAAIMSPFVLATKKYMEVAGETEPTARRLVELSKRWEESQVRLGRVTAEILLPTLEKALDVVDKITAFAEQNPGAVKAAVGIGGTLVALGGMLVTASQIVSTIATVQGLLAGAGIATGGATAAGGATAVTAGITAALPALGTAILAVLTSPLTWAVAALVLIKPVMNYLLGTNQTWADIAETGRKALILIGYGVDKLLKGIGSFFSNMAKGIFDALAKVGEFLVNGIGGSIAKLLNLIPRRASGGYVGDGIARVGEGGKREYVMSNPTVRAAERIIGGQITQQSLLAAMAGSRRISYNDNRRIDASLSKNQRRQLTNDILSGLAGAL